VIDILEMNKVDFMLRPNFKGFEIIYLVDQKIIDSDFSFNNNYAKWNYFNGNNRFEAISVLRRISEENDNYFFAPKNLQFDELSLIKNTLELNFDSKLGLLAFLTSGSSGKPKIVVHSIDTLIISAKKILEAYPIIKNKRFHHLFPVTYIAGILNCIIVPLIAEGSILFDNEFSFSSSFLLKKNIDKYNSQVAWLSPGMIASITALGEKFSTNKNFLDLVLSATGPLNSQLRAGAEKILNCSVLSTYGTSELLFISGERSSTRTVTIGEAFNKVVISQVPHSSEDSIYNPKEILISTDTKPVAVLQLANDSKSYIFNNSYQDNLVQTKDLGEINSNLIKIVGRTDDIIVLGGVNISLSKIENVTNSVDGVLESCARAEFEGTFSSIEILYEVSETSQKFSTEKLMEKLKTLGSESMPRHVTRVRFKRSHNGKINKIEIRKNNLEFEYL